MMTKDSISVIICSRNGIQFTERAIFSLIENVEDSDLEFILVDNGSIDGTKEFANKFRSIITHVDGSNAKSYSELNNIGVQHASHDILLFVNNDIEMITAGWDKVITNLLLDEKIGAVGVKQIFPHTHLIHHAGIVLDWNSYPTHIYVNENRDRYFVNKQRVMPMLNGAFLAVKRTSFLRVGGFDENYQFGFEDCDLCLGLNKIGLSSLYVPSVEIYHFGQASGDRTVYDKNNSIYFQKKWTSKLTPQIENFYKSDHFHEFSYIRNLKKKFKPKLNSSPIFVDPPIVKDTTQISIKNVELDIINNNSSFDQILGSFINHSSLSKFHYQKKSDVPTSSDDVLSLTWSHYWEHYRHKITNSNNLCLFAVNYEIINDQTLDPWAKSLTHTKAKLIAISDYCEQFLINAKVPKEKIAKINFGYSSEIDDLSDTKKENILTIFSIVNSHDPLRYGVDQLFEILKYFNNLYHNQFKVIIKDYGVGANNSMVLFGIEGLKSLGINVEYHQSFTTKNELLKHYQRSDIFLAPYRGEGYGLKILDAYAVGIPVAIPYYGGPVDYAKHGATIKLPYRLTSVGDCLDKQNWPIPDSYKWCEVNINKSAKALLDAANNIKELRKTAKANSSNIRSIFSWTNSIKQLDAIIEAELIRRTISINKKKLTELSSYDVSVVCNTFNSENKIVKFIQEMTNQSSDFSYELLIIDDGSTDKTIKVIENLDNPRVRLIKCDHKGPAAAKNTGIMESRGKFTIFCGDDIKPIGSFINNHINTHIKYSDQKLLVLGHTEWSASQRNSYIHEFMTKYSGTQFSFESFRNAEYISPLYCYTSNISFNTEWIRANNLFFNESFSLPIYEDTEWGARIEKSGGKLVYNRKIQALHDHEYTFDNHITRMRNVGRMSWLVSFLHPHFERIANTKISLDLYDSVLNLPQNCFTDTYNQNAENAKQLESSISEYLQRRKITKIKEWHNVYAHLLSKLHQHYYYGTYLATLDGQIDGIFRKSSYLKVLISVDSILSQSLSEPSFSDIKTILLNKFKRKLLYGLSSANSFFKFRF